MSQSIYREIGIDNAHHRTDTEQQDNDLNTIVEKEIDGAAQMRSSIQSKQIVNKPIGKFLNHNCDAILSL